MQAETKDFIDIEIFPCAGGMGEGFRRAGIEFDLMIEWMEDHCSSYEANLGHRPVQMDARDFLRILMMGWRPPKPVRAIVADPPCTPWSRAGKRAGQDDPRDMLDGTCRIIAMLQPTVYLIGNVPGLDDGPNLPIVQRTIGALSKHGYCTADFARLDAANYGVPQHRIRPFWFGHKAGPCIQWPAPTHGDPDDLRDQSTLPGITPLIPWITCKQALGHLPPDELGRPIKLRRRAQHSAQHGSVAEQPARVVGTSNLSDGNVLLPDSAPRAGKRGRPNQGQGYRTTDADQPARTIIGRPPRSSGGASGVIEQGTKMRARDRGRVPQSDRLGNPDRPSTTITARAPRARSGASATLDVSSFTIQDRRGRQDGLNTLDAPAHAIVKNTHGNGSILLFDAPGTIIENPRHPNADVDHPAPTLGAKERGQGGQVLTWTKNHPPSFPDEPAMTQRSSDGQGASRALVWPWNRPSTTVQADERLGPPGHHDENFRILSTTGDGIVISEKAASILQGFPDLVICGCGTQRVTPWERRVQTDDTCGECGERIAIKDWTFVGASKKARFSQIGQAMPAPLAHAVASSVATQIARTAASSPDIGRKKKRA